MVSGAKKVGGIVKKATIPVVKPIKEVANESESGASFPPPGADVNPGYVHRITNLHAYNELRTKTIKKNNEEDSTSKFNESHLLRRLSMKSLAETVVLRDD